MAAELASLTVPRIEPVTSARRAAPPAIKTQTTKTVLRSVRIRSVDIILHLAQN
jgi:hypothetical protein